MTVAKDIHWTVCTILPILPPLLLAVSAALLAALLVVSLTDEETLVRP